VQSKFDPLTAHGFNAVPAKISFCVSTTIFDRSELFAGYHDEFGLKVIVNDPLPAFVELDVSGVTPEIYAYVQAVR
jgi:hypothetical protein